MSIFGFHSNHYSSRSAPESPLHLKVQQLVYLENTEIDVKPVYLHVSSITTIGHGDDFLYTCITSNGDLWLYQRVKRTG